MRSYFGYVRVSTRKQGEGVSLQEQRAAISAYAGREGLRIVQWYEELETAAKRGRPVFTTLLARLRKGDAYGVIIHKIDRSARNLKDWADLGDLIDTGVDVRFATESLDLSSRGGRLSADIQAVVAADYIRNLREETRKGLYGRLKQGIYPLKAPYGYLDCGRGQVKAPDPKLAPFVRLAFELYATGSYSIPGLRSELADRGFRTPHGKEPTIGLVWRLLNNPFYSGVIRIKGQIYPGKHEPLVTTAMFDRVQGVLRGNFNGRDRVHFFLYRRMIRCRRCGRAVIGESQKGAVYYRCHNTECRGWSLREDLVNARIEKTLSRLRLRDGELAEIHAAMAEYDKDGARSRADQIASLDLQVGQLTTRADRLTDAYVDGGLPKEAYLERREKFLTELAGLRLERERVANGDDPRARELRGMLELLKTALPGYELAESHEKRALLDLISSNRWAEPKNVVVELRPAFHALANRPVFSSCDRERNRYRKWAREFACGGDFPVL